MIPFEQAARALTARVVDQSAAPATLSVTTDTRRIAPGQTFLALSGENFDGHAFTREAVDKGAAALIVSDERACIPGTAALVVSDTLRAFLALAALAREEYRGRVIAITGSTGKTTTKHLLAQLLFAYYGERVAASPANENNEIGVSKLLLACATPSYDVLVVEMGARKYGDIAPLVEAAKPDIGILTNVGEAHVEIMGSRERLAETKWQLFALGARAVLNGFDEVSVQRAPSLQRPPHWFAAADTDVLNDAVRSTVVIGQTQLTEHYPDGMAVHRAIDVRLPGTHNRFNLAAAIATARDSGVDLEAVVETIPRLELPSGRFERIVLPTGTQLIYDAYNANLSGMIAALDAFAQEDARRHIAVLASMAELGEEAPHMHEQVGEHAAQTGIDMLLTGGSFADSMAQGAQRAGLSSQRIARFATNDDAAKWLRDNARAGDVVLLKGSRVYKLEEVVERLRS